MTFLATSALSKQIPLKTKSPSSIYHTYLTNQFITYLANNCTNPKYTQNQATNMYTGSCPYTQNKTTNKIYTDAGIGIGCRSRSWWNNIFCLTLKHGLTCRAKHQQYHDIWATIK